MVTGTITNDVKKTMIATAAVVLTKLFIANNRKLFEIKGYS